MSLLHDPLFWAAGGIGISALGAVAAAASWNVSRLNRLDEKSEKISAQNERQLAKQDAADAKQEQFQRDWEGEPERSGVPARPGVLARLGKIENNTNGLPDRVKQLEDNQVATDAELRRLHERLDDHFLLQHGPVTVVPVTAQTPVTPS